MSTRRQRLTQLTPDSVLPRWLGAKWPPSPKARTAAETLESGISKSKQGYKDEPLGR